MSVYFYGRCDPYYEFSNFYRVPIKVPGDDRVWPTTEHYYQAMKFPHLPEYQMKIYRATSASQAAKLGRDRAVTLRSDWGSVKDEVMVTAIRAKFSSNPHLKARLLSTGTQKLVEKTTSDYYWGCGRNGTGQNKLGLLLMQVRDELMNP